MGFFCLQYMNFGLIFTFIFLVLCVVMFVVGRRLVATVAHRRHCHHHDHHDHHHPLETFRRNLPRLEAARRSGFYSAARSP